MPGRRPGQDALRDRKRACAHLGSRGGRHPGCFGGHRLRAWKPNSKGAHGHRQGVPRCLGSPGPQHFHHTRKCWGVREAGTPGVLPGGQLALPQHWGMSAGDCRGPPGAHPGVDKRSRLPYFEAGVGWRQDKAREERVEAARRRKVLGGQDFGGTFMMSYAEKTEDITKDEWMDKLNNVHIQRADMNRLIMNYLVTEGFKEAAEKFRMESGIEPSIDLDSLDERIKIREMILKGQIQEAIALINSLHPELLDTNRYLYFHLQQQHLIELIRQRETEAALEFAQTQLAEQGEESRECLTEMERTLALLAFDNPEESPFGDLLNMMQRQKVWSEVNQAVLDYENRESTPKLAKLLKLLLWAQNELDQKKVKYPKMTDLSKGTIEDPK
ncbi:GID8B protein, partial [Polypterus senegalus]